MDFIRNTHNSFSKQEPFIYDGHAKDDKDAVYHFVAFVFKNESIIELDGTKAGPIYYK